MVEPKISEGKRPFIDPGNISHIYYPGFTQALYRFPLSPIFYRDFSVRRILRQ